MQFKTTYFCKTTIYEQPRKTIINSTIHTLITLCTGSYWNKKDVTQSHNDEVIRKCLNPGVIIMCCIIEVYIPTYIYSQFGMRLY